MIQDELSDWTSLTAQTLWAIGWLSSKTRGPVSASRIAEVIGWAESAHQYRHEPSRRAPLLAAIDRLMTEGYVQSPDFSGPQAYLRVSTTPAATSLINEYERACLDRDIVIMSDAHRFIPQHRALTAQVLYNASRLGRQAVPNLELSDDDIPVLQKTLRAKILREYVLGVEDLGALLVAIRQRQEGGIFNRYLNMQINEVTDFFQQLRRTPTPPLEDLLHLPARAEMCANTHLGQAVELPHQLDATADSLQTVVRGYFDRDRLLIRTLNRTKHGFVMIDDMRAIDPSWEGAGENNLNIVVHNAFANPDTQPTATFTVPYLPLSDNEPPEIEGLRQITAIEAWLIDLIARLHSAGIDLAQFGR